MKPGEEDDVELSLGREWEKNIKGFELAIELFNIAYFIDEPGITTIILKF
ncbi:hypothetical protein [Chryseobacterium bernardetii]|nr:hypothetical protein [Chryseobacterium bernardetii]